MRTKTWLLGFLGLALASIGWGLLARGERVPVPTLRVEVLNGCGEDGLAARVGAHLRSLGQDVVAVEDAGRHDHPTTVLVDRRGRPDLAHRLADALGGPLVIVERVESPRADLTLLLGADYARYSVVADP